MRTAAGPSLNLELNNFSSIVFIVFGALLPDIGLFIMFGYAQLTDLPKDVIWAEMYYSDFWQKLGAISNSAPVFFSNSLVCWLIIRRSMQSQHSALVPLSEFLQGKQVMSTAFAVLVLSLASLLHVATDLPLHNDDGYAHFWPFTNWIFSSTVSFWDAGHYANLWVPIECVLGLTLVAILWRKTVSVWKKGLLFSVGLTYPVFALFFFS
ncbi:MAG: hypothetical protein ACI8UP_002367 [Porticoccaceae bacterium]|jgi:hypothetical protein